MEIINLLSLQNIGHATGMVGMACVVFAYFAVERDWFNNKEEAEEFFFQNKRIEDRKDFDKLYYVRKRNNTTQTK